MGIASHSSTFSSAAAEGSVSGTVYAVDHQRDSIEEFSLTRRGDQPPSAEIEGPVTRLSSPDDIAIDLQGDIDVPNFSAGEVDEYAPTANGDAAPAAILGGTATQLKFPEAIAIDDVGNIYVRCTHLLAVFAAGSTGNTPPIAVLAGPATHIDGSSEPGIAVDGAGQIYTIHNGTGATNAIDIFAAGANGNVRPLKTIRGDFTRLNGMVDVKVDARGTVYVLQTYFVGNNALGEVLEFPPGAHGNVPPNRIISGSNTTMVSSRALAIDVKGRVWVSQIGALLVFPTKATGNVAPLYTISGSATHLKDPRGIAFH